MQKRWFTNIMTELNIVSWSFKLLYVITVVVSKNLQWYQKFCQSSLYTVQSVYNDLRLRRFSGAQAVCIFGGSAKATKLKFAVYVEPKNLNNWASPVPSKKRWSFEVFLAKDPVKKTFFIISIIKKIRCCLWIYGFVAWTNTWQRARTTETVPPTNDRHLPRE